MSPPPVRAATSMFLIILAKSLPRRASTTAFLCLVVAHLLWPTHARSLTMLRQNSSVHPRIPRELRVERRGEQGALSDCHDLTVGGAALDLREDLDAGPGVLHPRRADEHRVHRGALDTGHVEVGLEGVDLPAEGVAADRDVEPADGLLPGGPVQHGCRRAGSSPHRRRTPAAPRARPRATAPADRRTGPGGAWWWTPHRAGPGRRPRPAPRGAARCAPGHRTRRRTRTCSWTSPCSASTPMRGALTSRGRRGGGPPGAARR